MGKLLDLRGVRFGRLTVISRAENHKKEVMWRCLCDCGNETVTYRSSLTAGTVKSCGCLAREAASKTISSVNSSGKTTHNRKHGASRTRLYRIWSQMKGRCLNQNNPAFCWYGGKGISVCNAWLLDFTSFQSWALRNGYDDTLTLDRIHNNEGYSPDNCRWVTRAEQNRNRSSNRVYKGRSLVEWDESLGLLPGTVSRRLFAGWELEQATSTPKCIARGKRYRK